MQYGGPAGGHPVDPRDPFALIPPELHPHAMNIMQSQNVSAEAACREVFDHFTAAMVADMNAREAADPDRSILDEEWTQLEPLYSKPTAYMHHMYKNQQLRELAVEAWEAYGKPSQFSEAEMLRVIQHALGEGQHEDVLHLHNKVHQEAKLDSVGALLEPYRAWLEVGGAFDLFSDMPPINQYRMPPELQPKNMAHLDQIREDIAKHLRDRNYDNSDIQFKLDEMFLDFGGLGARQSRWS